MVKLARVGVVIPARNETKNISQTLVHLVNQTIPPTQVVVVNDGSTDNTKELAEWFYPVVDFPIKHENWVAHKFLAQVFNFGLSQLDYSKLDYIMILGSDQLLPCHYLEIITQRMMQDNVAVASGAIKGEYSNVPRGSGRVVDVSFWQSLGLKYPVNWGYESYLLLKAWQQDKCVAYYDDLITTTQRKTSLTFKPTMYLQYGRAMKALGYTPIHMMARSLMFGKRKPMFAVKMIQGYLSAKKTDYYEPELRQFVRAKQYCKVKESVSIKGVRELKHRIFA